MCGIVGYIGNKTAIDILINGLNSLEYRGYDSSGIAVLENSTVQLYKTPGRVSELVALLPKKKLQGSIGLGHTRWATHGIVTKENAHPHTSHSGKFIVIHNGIFERHETIRQELLAHHYPFAGSTDTEVFIAYVDYLYDKEAALNKEAAKDALFINAVRRALLAMGGAYAIGVISVESNLLIAARNISPLVVGIGEEECFIASDPSAIIEHTDRFVFLPDRTLAILSSQEARFMDLSGNALSLPTKQLTLTEELSRFDEAAFPHKMLKEIYEQPDVLSNILKQAIDEDGHLRAEIPTVPDNITQIQLIACGSAFHAALYGKYVLEALTKLPTSVEIASEFRYRHPVILKNTLVIAISQSGETLDTLEALRHAKLIGVQTLGILNALNSAIAREVDDIFYLRAGKEIGVASTKAFTAMLLALIIFALHLANKRKTVTQETVLLLTREMQKLPAFCQKAIEDSMSESVPRLAKKYAAARSMYFIARGNHYPIALEGALKLKEISYIHAEGYPAGELKHGPIALIDVTVPTVAIATRGTLYEKTSANIHEILSRKGPVIALINEDDTAMANLVTDFLCIPAINPLLEPILSVIPLQLFAYQMATELDRDVDKPRNLAKSVTVE